MLVEAERNKIKIKEEKIMKEINNGILKIKHEYSISGNVTITAIALAFLVGKFITDIYQMKLEKEKK